MSFFILAISEVTLIQNNQYANGTYSGVAHFAPLWYSISASFSFPIIHNAPDFCPETPVLPLIWLSPGLLRQAMNEIIAPAQLTG